MAYPEEYDVDKTSAGYDHGFPEVKPGEIVSSVEGTASKEAIDILIGAASSGSWTTGTVRSGTTVSGGGTFITGALASGGTITRPSVKLPPRVPKVIAAPSQTPRKVLIAFLDENDEVEWCAKVRPESINTRFGTVDEMPEMDICFKLVEADNL